MYGVLCVCVCFMGVYVCLSVGTVLCVCVSQSQTPRVEAQTVLGSLVCFPNLYRQIPLLQTVPGTQDIVVGNEDIKVPHTCSRRHHVPSQGLPGGGWTCWGWG